MENRRAGVVEKHLEILFREGTLTGLDDGQLLERFAKRRDEAAFAALVERHGPMVLAACRGLLRDVHQADDVFQATFLVLARRAGAIRHPERLGAWLYGVTCHAASRAKRSESRRLRRESEAAMLRALQVRRGSDPRTRGGGGDSRGNRPLARARSNAGRALRLAGPAASKQRVVWDRRWAPSTAGSRGHATSCRRLARRGITLSAGAVASGAAATAVPDALAAEKIGAAVTFASGTAIYAVAAPGGILARELLKAMILTKSLSVAIGIGIISLGLLGSAALLYQDAELRSRQEAEAKAKGLAHRSTH